MAASGRSCVAFQGALHYTTGSSLRRYAPGGQARTLWPTPSYDLATKNGNVRIFSSLYAIDDRLYCLGFDVTSGTTLTAALVTHGAVDVTGAALVAANLRCFAIPSAAAADSLYVAAATTATQIDIRSTNLSVPYYWFVFYINS